MPFFLSFVSIKRSGERGMRGSAEESGTFPLVFLVVIPVTDSEFCCWLNDSLLAITAVKPTV